jgi:NAD(P)-dependent dehydrogenase (short-subunit alcohol dehydrogenase family)
MRFEDRVVVITGAGSGIGRATALAFAAEGAKIVAGEIDQARLDALVTELEAQQAQIAGVQGDVSKVEDCNRLIDTAKERFGRVDVLVNNAGVVDRFLPVGEMTDEVWNFVMGVNLNGPMYTMRRAVPIMLEQGKGVIINIASAAAEAGGLAGAAYTASKHGVLGLTQNTAWMYATSGIRAVTILPGGVSTNITLGGEPSQFGYGRLNPIFSTMPRTGEAQEIAHVIVFLASDEASFMNGGAIPVDGGWLAGG